MLSEISTHESIAPILSSLSTLRESLGWEGIAIALMLLPIVRILTYAFISPLGTILNALATVFGMLLQASVQIITACVLSFSQIALSWLQIINKSAQRFSSYILLFSIVIGSVLVHSYFIEQSPSLQLIAIDILCTLLVFALHKLYSLYSQSKAKTKREKGIERERKVISHSDAKAKDNEILFGKKFA